MSDSTRRRRRHRRRWQDRFKDALRERFWIVPATLIIVLVIGISGYWLLKGAQEIETQRVQAQTQQNVASGYRDILYKGKPYRYNSRITTVLYAGVDTHEPLGSIGHYMCGNMADSIQLLVLDEFNHKITIIALDRYTMTKIHRYTYKGVERAPNISQLCFAFSYGDRGKASCQNLCQAVTDLLYGIPVNEYVITNLSSLPVISDIIGNVKVKVPNNDLERIGILEGQDLVVNADNIETFVRYRDTHKDWSNVGRMERQRAYIDSAFNRLKQNLEDNPDGMWNSIKRMDNVMLTSITRNKYLDLIHTLEKTAYNAQDYYRVEGELKRGIFEEFYPDEDALLAKVVELFYIEK